MRALAARKHVLVEKPYTRIPEQVDEAWDEAERRGLVLEEAYMWRHSPQTKLLVELVPQVGEVRGVHVTFTAMLTREDDPRWVPELGGGALLDVGCYCVSAARLLLGEPDRVHGEARIGRGGVDTQFAGTLRFGDVTATFQCGLRSSFSNELEVIGTEGILRVPSPFVDPPGLVIVNGEEHRVDAGNHYRAELDDMCAAIRGERGVLLGRDEMRGQATVLNALLSSAGL
jgi:predicted dehydrogenase